MTNETHFTVMETAGTKVGESIDLGTKDAKGRAIGYLVFRWEVTIVENPHQNWGYTAATLPAPVGSTLYCGRVTATRDGQGFGACQPTIYGVTPDSRELEIARKVADG